MSGSLALPAAKSLCSRTGCRSLQTDVIIFVSGVTSRDFDLKSAIPLLEEAGSRANDQKIWDTAIAIVTPKLTPPTLLDQLPLDTPCNSISSPQRAIEEIHDEVDECILQEINGCVYNDTGGFYERYSKGKS